MITFSAKFRSKQAEIMDDLDFGGSEMSALLKDLAFVNRWLGGNSITWNGVKKLIRPGASLRVLDMGCGDGAQLRYLAVRADDYRTDMDFTGVDANGNILEEARAMSRDFGRIHYRKLDVFSEELDLSETDVVLCTLFLHHFSNERIIELLLKVMSQVKVGVVVNDLHRSPLAFGLYRIFSRIFLKTKTAKHDGLVSIARGFRRKEIQAMADALSKRSAINFKSKIRWKWAFRYQWILSITE